jgi:hypothetical protein
MSEVLQFKSEPAELKLNLGCNQNKKAGYVNVDVEKYDAVDVVADLEKRWPWKDGTVTEIVTNDLPEHLRQVYEVPDPVLLKQAVDEGTSWHESICSIVKAIEQPKRTYGIFHFMNEAHRVLKPGGMLKAQIPTTEHRAWAQDPTHVSYWNENTFLYFCDDGYRAIYPRAIKGKWKSHWVGTSMPNPRGESWVRVILEKVA